MGRKKIYITEEERKEPQRRWNMEYYERNKEKIKRRAVKRYRDKKINDIKKDLYGEQ